MILYIFKLINKMKITLFASELAIVIRPNKYEGILKVLLKLWEKNYPDDYKNTIKLMNDTSLDINLIQDIDKNIKNLSKKYNLDLNSEIDSSLKSNNISTLKKTQQQILSKCKIDNKEDLNLLKKSIMSKTNTNFGTKYEGNSIDIYQAKTGKNVNSFTKFISKKIITHNDINWYIGGKIDGITDDNILIEVKNRTSRLFYNLRDYEKTQIMAYLNILDLESAHLVESLKNNSQEMNIIEVDYDNEYWDTEIINKVIKFVKFFNIFLENDSYKIAVLNKPSILNEKYDQLSL